MSVADPSSNRPSTAFLDGLRGLAAVYVLVAHARILLHEGYVTGYRAHPETYSLLETAILFALYPFRAPRAAVLFFFVLSGFVIHLRYAERLAVDPERTRFDLLPYLRRRALRLYPPMLVALLLTAAIDAVGTSAELTTYRGPIAGQLVLGWQEPRHDIGTLVANLAFLQHLAFPTFGSNQPLWSLAYEGWFYLTYPLLFAFARQSAGATLAIFGGSVAAAIVPFPLPPLERFLSLLPYWWLGAVLAEVHAGRLAIPFRFCAVAVLALPVAFVWNGPDALGALGSFGSIALCFALEARGARLRVLDRLRPLGDASYSIYLTHLPILLLAAGLVIPEGSVAVRPQGFAPLGAAVAVSLGVGWLIARVAERPFRSRSIPGVRPFRSLAVSARPG